MSFAREARGVRWRRMLGRYLLKLRLHAIGLSMLLLLCLLFLLLRR